SVGARRGEALAVRAVGNPEYEPRMPAQGAEPFAGGKVPQGHDPVVASGRQPEAVGTERRRPNDPLVSGQLGRYFTGCNVPDSHHLVGTGRRQRPAVRPIANSVNRGTVTQDL